MKRLTLIIALLCAACTRNPYPGIDTPIQNPNTDMDKDIIAYIDQRLVEEYYWLDEVEEKSYLFDREYSKWSDYLNSSLSKLTTNLDDGYVKSDGQRSFYSYISELSPSTRATTSGFGILLHYTILVGNGDNNYYYFIIDHVYPDSPAAKAGIKRGDMITKVNDSFITSSNYASHFTAIQNNTKQSLKLKLKRQTTGDTLEKSISKATYDASPVAHHELIEVEGKKIGYLAYTSFDNKYDEELIAALGDLASEGAEELVLDLRINRGGSVNSAAKLCAALMPAIKEGRTLCTLVRNPRNKKTQQATIFNLEGTGSVLSLDKLTVICSNYSASASELVVMGLRGIDVPVTLIGSQTEGKNCGMDVTRVTIGSKYLEFAPITFMCLNAKGVGDWGEGIVPDVNLKEEANGVGVHDANYPMPRADWGDERHDIALATALAKITGKGVTMAATRSAVEEQATILSLDCPVEGIRLYEE